MKNSKTNSKSINTGYPALDPTANKYLSGSGWEIYVVFFCFSVFLFSFEFVYVFVLLLYVFLSIVNAKA